ncbi:MAG: nucleotide-diphospho-sugar transferase [Bacteroidetes bacterium]|nr:MAG: nucleotide-diphospho-sugar transferase [Bacteroidota bacterium]
MEQIRLAAPVRLYAHCDGPRQHVAADQERTSEVRALIEELGPSDSTTLKTLFRSENKGLRQGVYEAVSWFFAQEEYGIILEDDCMPDLSLFPFCTELLERYRNSDRIMHIGCSNLAADPDPTTSYYFSRFTFVWGWASWRRAWEKMDLHLKELDQFERNGTIQRFLSDPMAQTYMLDKFRQTRSGRTNSWAYAWFYSILHQDGLSIVPSVNLVTNTGVGLADATNTTQRNRTAQQPAGAIDFPLSHPDSVMPDPEREIRFFYTSQKRRIRLWFWYILHRIGLR